MSISFISSQVQDDPDSSFATRQNNLLYQNQGPSFSFEYYCSPLITAQELVSKSSQSEISSGVLIMYSLYAASDQIQLNNISTETKLKLASIIADAQYDIQLRNQVLEFVALLCKREVSFVHYFWGFELYKVLLNIIADEKPTVNLTAPIEILAKMCHWTIASNFRLLESNIISLLLQKLTQMLSIPDYYGVLKGISAILESKYTLKNVTKNEMIQQQFAPIVQSVTNYMMNPKLGLPDQLIGESFNILYRSLNFDDTLRNENADQTSIQPLFHDFDFAPLCNYSVRILQNQHLKNEVRVKVGRFICDVIYESDEIGRSFLEMDIFPLFHKLNGHSSEDLIVVFLMIAANCVFSSPDAVYKLEESKFLEDASNFLSFGTLKIKTEALRLFYCITTSEGKFFNPEFARATLEKYQILDAFGDIIEIECENDGQIKNMIVTCLLCIVNSFNVYECRSTSGQSWRESGQTELPPPIAMCLEESHHECLEKLALVNEKMIVDNSSFILNEIKNFIQE